MTKKGLETLIYNTTPLNIPIIQEHINKKKKQLKELELLYEKRNQLNPLRWNIKPRYTGIKTHFSHLKEQIRNIL